MLGQLIIKTLELLEAEGRLLRHHVVRIGLALAALALLGMLGLVGVLLLLAALFIELCENYGPAAASLVCGALLTAIAAAGTYGTWRWTQN